MDINNIINNNSSLEARLHNFQTRPSSLRIPASQVSALAGLHPYQNLPQLLYDFVYQSYLGQLLLQKDATALGLTLVDAKTHEEKIMLNLASTASTETKELVKQVLEVSSGKRKLQSVNQVQEIQTRIKHQAKEAQKSGKMSQKQVEQLVEASRGHVSTGFGTCHEEEALDVYEKRVGCCVRERNEALMEWRFDRRVVEGGVTAVPLGVAMRRGIWKQQQQQQQQQQQSASAESVKREGVHASNGAGGKSEPLDVDEVTNAKSGESKRSNIAKEDEGNDNVKPSANEDIVINDDGNDTDESKTKPAYEEEARSFFKIVGAVDGIRDELYMDNTKPTTNDTTNNVHNQTNKTQSTYATSEFSDDEDNWSLRPIIVECKHRIHRAQIPPPIYDQVQTCLYCNMYGVEEADLIQVVRRQNEPSQDDEADNKDNADTEESNEKKKKRNNKHIEITISRISLNEPIHNHNHHWNATILPRIASFVDAVYSIRGDDGKRYRLLMSVMQCQDENAGSEAEEEAWKVLWEECPWLIHCNTSYRKKRRF
eukprot:g5814.t1 g5814   contig20:220941-222560(+)